MLEQDGRLDGYRYLPSTKADLLRRLNRRDEAAASYQDALALTENAAERAFLERRIEIRNVEVAGYPAPSRPDLPRRGAADLGMDGPFIAESGVDGPSIHRMPRRGAPRRHRGGVRGVGAAGGGARVPGWHADDRGAGNGTGRYSRMP